MYDISPPDMHVEVENAEEEEWSQSGCGERMDRLEDDQKPGQKIPSKLEVAPPPKCGLDGWVMGDTP